eukprot:TRINITY_DN17642_c0_g1_i1.p2 TRINITY_DN17642_c0_g1~~TRINITY_DN17642_c0_g1_i1.p2  ORF type:complete len:157 (-),score=19.86 TRINITY_DN17642_c0_g1_i1:46-456(-)
MGLGMGAIYGGALAAWEDTVVTQAGKTAPALRAAFVTCARTSLFFGGCCAAFEGSRCLARSFRGVHDTWNSFYGAGGVAAVIGIRTGSVPRFAVTFGTLGAALLFFGYFDNSPSPHLTELRAQRRAELAAAAEAHH